MVLGGVSPNVTTELNALITQSAFQTSGRQPDPIEQVQPNQLEERLEQTDSVNISDKALELSRQAASKQKK